MADSSLAPGDVAGSLFSQSISGLPGALQTYSSGLDQANQEERGALQKGIDWLQNYGEGPVNIPLMAWAAGMGAPTKTGSFGESMANGFGQAAGALQSQRTFDLQRADKLLALEQANANLTRQAAGNGLDVIGRGLTTLGQLGPAMGGVADTRLIGGAIGGAGPVPALSKVPGAGMAAPSAVPMGGAVPPPAGGLGAVAGVPAALPGAGSALDGPAGANSVGAAGMPGSPGATAAGASPPGAPAASPNDLASGVANLQFQADANILADARANPGKYAGPAGQNILKAAIDRISKSPQYMALTKGAEAAATTPIQTQGKIESSNASKFYQAQDKAQSDAFADAQQGLTAKQQAQAMLSVMFDQNGNPTINSGPLGEHFSNAAAVLTQAGFSPTFVKMFTSTDPNNAQELQKLRTAMGTEVAKQTIGPGSQLRVAEFNQFLNTTPGETLLPQAFKWIVNNTILPKADAQIGRYDAVKSLDPGKDNIRAALFDYDKNNPWFKATNGTGQQQQGQASPAPAPGQGSSPAQAASSGAPVPVTTKAAYDALPSGTRYQAPDGSIRIKG